jgi:hypothetical protein
VLVLWHAFLFLGLRFFPPFFFFLLAFSCSFFFLKGQLSRVTSMKPRSSDNRYRAALSPTLLDLCKKLRETQRDSGNFYIHHYPRLGKALNRSGKRHDSDVITTPHFHHVQCVDPLQSFI